jgi:hypothetical protein
MCKPSCCPGTGSSSGLGPLAAIAALVLVAAIAGPVAAAAASLLHALILIVTIAAATLAGIAVLAVTVAIIRRARRATRPHRPIPARVQQAHPLVTAAPLALPRSASRFELTPGERARCAALGIDPDQTAQIMAAVLGGPQ